MKQQQPAGGIFSTPQAAHLLKDKAAVERLAHRRASLHEAHHEVMEALGQMVWASQRSGQPFDGEAYIAEVLARASR